MCPSSGATILTIFQKRKQPSVIHTLSTFDDILFLGYVNTFSASAKSVVSASTAIMIVVDVIVHAIGKLVMTPHSVPQAKQRISA